MRSKVQRLYHEYGELVRSLDAIYAKIQASFTLIERVHWKIHWMEVRDTCILQLNEKISALVTRNECNAMEKELLSITLSRIEEGFVKETSYSEKSSDSLFSYGLKLNRIDEELGYENSEKSTDSSFSGSLNGLKRVSFQL
jgi:hypothetical protein